MSKLFKLGKGLFRGAAIAVEVYYSVKYGNKTTMASTAKKALNEIKNIKRR